MIEYICPECGAKVNVLCLTSLPPIYHYKCSKCSYEYEVFRYYAEGSRAGSNY